MAPTPVHKSIRILSRSETRDWHTPISAVLRKDRRERIIDECRQRAASAGHSEFAIFDAYENLLVEGSV
jgi:hypothetical protein